MKLKITDGILHFHEEGHETEAELAFLERMKQYQMKINGATILVNDLENHLIACIKPFDNTLHICEESGYAFSEDFGAKRFLAGEAHRLMLKEQSKHDEVMKFPRDLPFPLENQAVETVSPYRQLDLASALEVFRSNPDNFYCVLADLFNRCADFTPGKQAEYLALGKKEDKYCRFNLMNNEEKQSVSTEHVFLMDNSDKIRGTISATVIRGNDGRLDIYFYDEIVDYFTLLTPAEINRLYEMTQQLNIEEDATVKSLLENQITALIEPKRIQLMAQLFKAARQSMRHSISDLDQKIADGKVHAFIRAAAGRVDAYVAELGCGSENTEHFVIHGKFTPKLTMLDAYVKTWAAEQLIKLQPKLGASGLLSSSPRKVDVTSDGLTHEAKKMGYHRRNKS